MSNEQWYKIGMFFLGLSFMGVLIVFVALGVGIFAWSAEIVNAVMHAIAIGAYCVCVGIVGAGVTGWMEN